MPSYSGLPCYTESIVSWSKQNQGNWRVHYIAMRVHYRKIMRSVFIHKYGSKGKNILTAVV